MAAAIMQPARPSMDRSSSFEHPRSRSATPFYGDRAPSPAIRPPIHSRNSSSSSYQSHQQQQVFPNYYNHPNANIPNQHWTSTPLPASSFYASPFQPYAQQHHLVNPQQQQPPQVDLSAWTNAYHHMVMASVANGAHPGVLTPPPTTEFFDGQGGDKERRRTNSGPQRQTPGSNGYFDSRPPPTQQQQQQPQPKIQPPQPFHPYKRGPSHRSSRENVKANTAVVMPRSVSQPNMPSAIEERVPSPSIGKSAADHARTSSVDSAPRVASPAPVPRVASPQPQSRPGLRQEDRRPSFASDRARDKISPTTATPPSSTVRHATPTPLHPGPITAATNMQTPRPSPLSQTPATVPEPEKPKGLKSMLKKALDKDASARKMSTAPSATSTPIKQSLPPSHSTRSFASPALSDASTMSVTPPSTPPQEFEPPSAPFSLRNPAAMNSDVSLAETERTATGPPGKKEKKGLFRMRNMSTDNISLSSTVSSASMMIRKMGSIGKLARRNSLMGISKIFKDKPKDEDAPLAEREVKKDKKKKNKKGKGDPVQAEVSMATAETEEEDRSLVGLSPAAKLARQHTLKSKAESAQKEAEASRQHAQRESGETARQAAPAPGSNRPEVVRVQPRTTVVRAVAVSEQEYDSDDDSSEGETVEDLTATMGKVRLSEEADAEFQATWGNAYIDKNLVPKKGILKVVKSQETIEVDPALRQRSNSTADLPTAQIQTGPLAHPPANPDQLAGLDGIISPSPQKEILDPLSTTFAPFDTPEPDTRLGFYANPNANTSAPTLSLLGQGSLAKPVTPRSMTAPAARKRLVWAPECAVYSTYDSATYDRHSEPATCNRLTPELAMAIKQELNAFKLEMPIHPSSRVNTHYFA